MFQTFNLSMRDKTMYYVTMTDNFMSGWGMADGKINKFVVHCDTIEQAEQIEQAANDRSEMDSIKISESMPYYSKDTHLISERDYDELGDIWKPEV